MAYNTNKGDESVVIKVTNMVIVNVQKTKENKKVTIDKKMIKEKIFPQLLLPL